MTTDEKKDLIVQLVEDMSGCKVMELVVKYTVAVINAKICDDEIDQETYLDYISTDEPLPDEDEFNDEDVGNEFLRLVYDLVKEKRVIEIEYVLPDSDAHMKSYLLPVGAQIKLSSNWAGCLWSVNGEYREVIRMVRD